MGTRKALGRAVAAFVLSALIAALLVALRSTATAAVPGDPLCVNKPATVAAGATKVLVAGDSLTSASAGDYTWRYFLWKHLVNPNGLATPAPAAYDFVGPYTNMVQPVSPYARTSDEYNCDFDKDNGAIPGASLAVRTNGVVTGGYLAEVTVGGPLFPTKSTALREMLKDQAANILVMFAGAQDLGKAGAVVSTVLGDAHTVALEAQKANPNTDVVFVTAPQAAGTPAAGTVAAKVADFNTQLLASAPGWSVGNSSVAVAHAAQDWGTPALTYDTIHPNPQGEVSIAADVADALHSVLPAAPAAVRPLPNYASYVGPHLPSTLAQPTVSGTTVSLSWTLPPGATVSAVQRKDYTENTGWITAPTAAFVPGGQAGPPYVSTFSDPTYVAGHVYQYRIVAAKGTTVWTDIAPTNTTFRAPPYVQYSTTITSNVVTVPAGATLPPTATVTPTGTGTPTSTGTPTGTGTPTPTNTNTATPTGTGTGTPTPTNTNTATPTPTNTNTATPGPPGAIPSFSATPSVHGMTLVWGAATSATGYRFSWRVAGSSTNFSKDVGAAVRSYNITGLVAGRTYGFRVRALNGDLMGPLTVELNRVPKPYVLAKPAKPTLTTVSGHRIKATWPAVAKASRYEVQIRVVGGTFRTAGNSAARAYTSGRLVAGKAYEIRVRACDGLAPGPYSLIARIRAK